MSEAAPIDPNVVVSHEDARGRVLSGVGVSVDSLEAVMERHAPPEDSGASSTAESGTGEAAPASSEGSAATGTTTPPETRGRKRFADLTREREAARQEAAAEKTRAATLERELADLKARQSQPSPTHTPARETAAPAEPAKFTFPAYEEFVASVNPAASYDDWQDAKDEARYQWRAQNDLEPRFRQRIEADRQARTFQETVAATHDRARKAYPDFDRVLSGGSGALVPLGPTPQEAVQRATFIIQHPQSEHLQYAIMKDGALAQRLQQMDPFTFALEVAKLAPTGSVAIPASTAASGSVPPPAPYQPVGSGSTTTALPSAELARKGGYDFDKSGYREKRAAERGVSRRR